MKNTCLAKYCNLPKAAGSKYCYPHLIRKSSTERGYDCAILTCPLKVFLNSMYCKAHRSTQARLTRLNSKPVTYALSMIFPKLYQLTLKNLNEY